MNLDQVDQYLRSIDPDTHLEIIMGSNLHQATKDEIKSIASGNSPTYNDSIKGRHPMLLLGHGFGRNHMRIDVVICFFKDTKDYYSINDSYLDRYPSAFRLSGSVHDNEESEKYTPYWSDSTDYFISIITQRAREYKIDLLTNS